jgi:oligo-1,6-glucosidase
MLYHFEGMGIGYLPDQFKQMNPDGYSLIEFKRVYSKWDSVFEKMGWGTIYLGNHDQPRMVSRWGNDAPKHREASSKMLTTFLLTMRGTPYYYFGDELGMNNIKFDRIEDYRDIETINMYQKTKNEGGDLEYFLTGQKISARDNGRTPFPWDATKHAGFTTGTPWLKINPNNNKINVEVQDNDPNSVLNYFRKMVKMRKQLPELIYGKYELLDESNEKIYAYTRTWNAKKVLVLLNFSSSRPKFIIPGDSGNALNVLMNNVNTIRVKNNSVTMEPWQALVIRMQ